jgi:hypothetical protein
MKRAGLRIWIATLALSAFVAAGVTAGAASNGISGIKSQDVKEWLTYIASTNWKGGTRIPRDWGSRRHTSRTTFAHGG